MKRTRSGGLKSSSSNSMNFLTGGHIDDNEKQIDIHAIKTPKDLEDIMNTILSNLQHDEHLIREVHEYTQILPAKYYEPGSHHLNRQVAFALKSVDIRLFYSWIMLRSKADDFDYEEIPKLYSDWMKYFKSHKTNGSSITYKSIIYWAQHDADHDEYEKVKMNTVNHYIDESLEMPTDYDFAKVLHHMFKDRYVCSSLINKTWYIFENHRWRQDKGLTIRNRISEEMYSAYRVRVNIVLMSMHGVDPGDDEYALAQRNIKHITEISTKLKRTADKNNIFKEVHELFYDEEFIKKMDENRYLLGCANGVLDLKNKCFRCGYPNDYITKTTNIDYLGEDLSSHQSIMDQITLFMNQIIPVPSLNKYVWDHLASVLIGENRNQTFNIYRGNDSNGKSLLTELMELVLGEYFGHVPITLVTEKRVSIGGTSSEIMQLKGVRYALMQEPSVDMKINEGMMKQLTGDSKLQGRALYADTETFKNQFNLVVCTNNLFEVGSNDDGTWRRIRIVEFMSKFVNDDDPVLEETPFQFKKDPNLSEKLSSWAPIFLSMLVHRVYKTEGIVENCDEVMMASNKYRQGQDHISAFLSEKVIIAPENASRKVINKKELLEEFKTWFNENLGGNRKAPKGTQVVEYMDKKYGKYKKGTSTWYGLTITYPDREDEDDIEDAVDEY